MTKSELASIKDIIKTSTRYNRWDARSIEWTIHRITSMLENMVDEYERKR